MPVEFVEELENIKIYENYWTYAKELKYGKVNANSIRKWNYNFLILNGVPESVADFIQGKNLNYCWFYALFG